MKNYNYISDIKGGSPSSHISTSNTEQSSSPYNLTSLPSMNNGGVSGLMLPHASIASYHSTGQRSDSNIKIESPENLTAHAQYSSPSPVRHHSVPEQEQHYSHSVSTMGITSGDSSGALGTVSVGAS